jgi:peptidoglycan/xylan/chitin deacetylase (PgdA/CDA1 family)
MRVDKRCAAGAAFAATLGLSACGGAHPAAAPAWTAPAAVVVATPSPWSHADAAPGTSPVGRPGRRPHVQPDVPLGSLTYAPGHAGDPAGAVGLTFDDGPDPDWTPAILATLARFHAHATFFDIGQNVARHPGLARAEYAAGDGVGNHTETHPDLTTLSAVRQARQIELAAATIRTATGATPICMRPPYDAIDPTVEEVTAQQHEALMLYDVDTRDWTLPGVRAIAARALAGARPGAVIDMHDAGGDRSETVAALPLILRGLQARHLVPVAFCRA